MRRRLDWVQNPDSYAGIDTLTFNVGQANAFALPLTYAPRSLVGGQGFLGANVSPTFWMADAAIPNSNRGLIVRAVHWWAHIEPSTWALGSMMTAGMRLTIQDQDQTSGAASVVGGYSMWDASTVDKAYIFADENFLTERRVSKAFGDASSTPLIQMSGRWSGRKRIPPQQALFAFFEAPTNSVNMRMRHYFFRTLVEIP